MAGNSYGELFRVTTFGESHGGALGAVVDGCPAGLELQESDIQSELDRRKPGQSTISTPRKEEDRIAILSGVFEGHTTGTPILLLAHNTDMRSEDYAELAKLYRPSHADYTYQMKYGCRDYRGSGRASARETLARVAAGAIARKFLRQRVGIEILAYVEQVYNIKAQIEREKVSSAAIENSLVRCPDPEASQKMLRLIEQVRDDGDSVGGVIGAVVRGVTVGLGEPVFDKLTADLGKAILSINAAKGFEIGEGFGASLLLGSEHNDPFGRGAAGEIVSLTNHAGGVLGGISSGADLYFRAAFKPVATIKKEQNTVSTSGKPVKFCATGRHDPCVLPRAVPIVEAMAAIVLIDHWLRNRALAGAV